jgi:hypothetical protein
MGSFSEEVCICAACPPVDLPVDGFISATFSAAGPSAMPVLALISSSNNTRPVMEVSEDAVLEPDIMKTF